LHRSPYRLAFPFSRWDSSDSPQICVTPRPKMHTRADDLTCRQDLIGFASLSFKPSVRVLMLCSKFFAFGRHCRGDTWSVTVWIFDPEDDLAVSVLRALRLNDL